jgi:hypothetical protein
MAVPGFIFYKTGTSTTQIFPTFYGMVQNLRQKHHKSKQLHTIF